MNLPKLRAALLMLLTGCSATPPTRTIPPTLQNIDYALRVDMDAYVVPEASIDFSDAGSDSGDATALLTGPFTHGEAVAPLRRTQQAPFDGVLFNAPALATIEVEFRASDAVCRVNGRAAQQRLAARAVADIERLQTSFRAHDTIARSIVSQQERDYQTLSNSVRQIRSGETLRTVGWVSLGVLSGLVVGGVVGYTIYTVRSAP